MCDGCHVKLDLTGGKSCLFPCSERGGMVCWLLRGLGIPFGDFSQSGDKGNECLLILSNSDVTDVLGLPYCETVSDTAL